MGRIANLVCYILLYGLAIVIVPRMKAVLLILGVMPTSVFVASSLMCDALPVSLCTLSVALTLRVLARPRGACPTLALGALAGAVLLCKAAYVPVCLGFVVMPHDRVRTGRKLLALAPVLACLILYLVWSAIYGDNVYRCNVSDNLSYLAGNLPVVILRLAYALINLPMLLAQADSTYQLLAIMVLVVVAMDFARNSSSKDARGKVRTPSRLLSRWRYVFGALLAALVAVLGTYLFMLVIWNDVAQQPMISLIEGFQGRYLLPVYPLLCYLQTVFDDAAREGDARTTEGHAPSSPGERTLQSMGLGRHLAALVAEGTNSVGRKRGPLAVLASGGEASERAPNRAHAIPNVRACEPRSALCPTRYDGKPFS